jgi:hypothetical protein
MDRPRTLPSIELWQGTDELAMPRALAVHYTVIAHCTRSGHALGVLRLAWAGRSQRPPEWASLLGFGAVGHCGYGLPCSPLKQWTFPFFLRIIQIDFNSKLVRFGSFQILFKLGI